MHTHTRPTHSPPSNRCLFLGRSLCLGTRKSRGRAFQKNNSATLSKWAELREECAALCQYCPVDSTVFLVSPFAIRRPIRNQMVAPRLVSVGYSLQISNERRLRTHAQRPTHSPSNRRLFLGRSLCRGTRKSRGRT